MSAESLDEMARALVDEMIANTENRSITVELVIIIITINNTIIIIVTIVMIILITEECAMLFSARVSSITSIVIHCSREPLSLGIMIRRIMLIMTMVITDDADDSEKQFDCGGATLSSCLFSLAVLSL